MSSGSSILIRLFLSITLIPAQFLSLSSSTPINPVSSSITSHKFLFFLKKYLSQSWFLVCLFFCLFVFNSEPWLLGLGLWWPWKRVIEISHYKEHIWLMVAAAAPLNPPLCWLPGTLLVGCFWILWRDVGWLQWAALIRGFPIGWL